MGGASPESAIYSGENLATGVPRFVLDNAVPDRDVCVTVVFEATGASVNTTSSATWAGRWATSSRGNGRLRLRPAVGRVATGDGMPGIALGNGWFLARLPAMPGIGASVAAASDAAPILTPPWVS